MLQYNHFRCSVADFLEKTESLLKLEDGKITNLSENDVQIIHNTVPHNRYICVDNQLAIDHVYKLETLSAEFDDFKRTYSIDPAVQFPHLHKHQRVQDKMLNETLAAQIYDMYKRDFELLGYDKDSWREF